MLYQPDNPRNLVNVARPQGVNLTLSQYREWDGLGRNPFSGFSVSPSATRQDGVRSLAKCSGSFAQLEFGEGHHLSMLSEQPPSPSNLSSARKGRSYLLDSGQVSIITASPGKLVSAAHRL